MTPLTGTPVGIGVVPQPYQPFVNLRTRCQRRELNYVGGHDSVSRRRAATRSTALRVSASDAWMYGPIDAGEYASWSRHSRCCRLLVGSGVVHAPPSVTRPSFAVMLKLVCRAASAHRLGRMTEAADKVARYHPLSMDDKVTLLGDPHADTAADLMDRVAARGVRSAARPLPVSSANGRSSSWLPQGYPTSRSPTSSRCPSEW